MEHRLKKWAVIDIETTGADPAYDQIIDVGFLLFEGTRLKQKYTSLCRYDGNLSSFIQKLTGITPKMLLHAPSYKEVEKEIQDLFGVKLIAHNSDFEKNFLKKSFDKIDDGSEREEFCDTLLLFSMLFPEYGSLKLEQFILDFNIRESEVHRGIEDSIDLLKVLLVSVGVAKKDKAFYQFIKLQILEKKLSDFYLFEFLNLSDEELKEIGEAIDFNVEEKVKEVWQIISKKRFPEFVKKTAPKKLFSLDFNGENIKEIFSSDDKIKILFPTYKKRKAQIEMSLKVGQSFKNNVHGLIQAPTGTGKTFGYLIPSVLFSLNEKKQVLVATGTKTLQHQAFSKDVPYVKEFLGLADDEIKIKLLVGSNNHLCESLFRQEEAENSLIELASDFNQRFVSMYFELIFFYNSRCVSENKILRDDLPYVLKRKIEGLDQREKEIAVDFRSCTGSNCPFKNQCSYIVGLREAKDADIIIGNHSLMLSWPKGMPRPLHVVVDEAHKIEDEATKSFSLEIDQKSFESFVGSLQHLQGIGSLFYLLAQNEEEQGESNEIIKSLREATLSTFQMLFDHVRPISDLMSLYFKKMPKYTENYWNELPMINRLTHTENIAREILNHVESFKFILENYYNQLLPYSNKFDVKNLKNENEIMAFTRFESFFSQVADYVNAFDKLINPVENYCRSMKYLESEGYLFTSSPVDIGRIVCDQLLKTSASVVYTSATLANNTGDTGAKGIEWSTGYSYLEPERRFKSGTYLESTYDYKNKTKIFLCDDGPSLYQSNFVEFHLKKIIPLIEKLGGRSLLLFSAKVRFETAREILLSHFEGQLPVFIQGMGASVVDDFKKSKNGILLGMESFGEGIDVPGDALQFIFIDKVPDLRMDLVINERRDFFESHLGNEFTDYYLAHRTRSLHQKLGRLLRTESDYGGVIISDNRVKSWKGKTMEKLVKLMEPYELKRAHLDQACDEIQKFIEDHPKN